MAINKSDIVNQLKKSYPNFLKRDLERLISIVLNEIKRALRRADSVELRGFGRLSVKTQRSSIRRNPKTSQKVAVPEKKVIRWKQSKDLFKKINNKDEE